MKTKTKDQKFTAYYNRVTRIAGYLVKKSVIITKLAARYNRLVIAQKVFHKTLWEPAFQAIVKVKEAHAKPTHKHTCVASISDKSCNCWWLYNGTANDAFGGSVGFDWVTTPKKPKNHKIGQRYYELDRQYTVLNNRKLKFAAVLDAMIISALYDKLPSPNKTGPRIISVIINGEEYWYTTASHHSGGLFWERLVWPENKIIPLILI